jgi:hypothetical protein
VSSFADAQDDNARGVASNGRGTWGLGWEGLEGGSNGLLDEPFATYGPDATAEVADDKDVELGGGSGQ